MCVQHGTIIGPVLLWCSYNTELNEISRLHSYEFKLFYWPRCNYFVYLATPCAISILKFVLSRRHLNPACYRRRFRVPWLFISLKCLELPIRPIVGHNLKILIRLTSRLYTAQRTYIRLPIPRYIGSYCALRLGLFICFCCYHTH